MDNETASALRSLVRLVRMKNTDDGGETQTVSIELADGHWRDKVEVMQPYGFASHVPDDGALGLAFQIAGDDANMVVLPVGNPSARMGQLAANEVGLYNADGDKMVLKPGGTLDIQTGAEVIITTDSGVTITATVTKIVGDLECTGDVSDKNGPMQEMRDLYNAHGHPDAAAPPSPLQD